MMLNTLIQMQPCHLPDKKHFKGHYEKEISANRKNVVSQWVYKHDKLLQFGNILFVSVHLKVRISAQYPASAIYETGVVVIYQAE